MERVCNSSFNMCFISSSPYLHGLKSARNAQFWLTSEYIKCFRSLVLGVFWLVLSLCLYFWAIWFPDIDCWDLRMKNIFKSYGCTFSSPFFLQVVTKKKFRKFLKTNYTVFLFFSMLIVFWCSTPFTAVVVSWTIIMEPIYAPNHWWPCWCWNCVSGLIRLEQNLHFRDAIESRTWCSNVLQAEMKEKGYTSRFLHSVGEFSCMVFWNEFFSSEGQVLKWNLLALQFYHANCEIAKLQNCEILFQE